MFICYCWTEGEGPAFGMFKNRKACEIHVFKYMCFQRRRTKIRRRRGHRQRRYALTSAVTDGGDPAFYFSTGNVHPAENDVII